MTPPIGSARAGLVSQVEDFIADSAIEQWTADGYDDANDKWVGQLGNFDLTGGTANKNPSGANGNTVVEYDGSVGQEHVNTSISINYDRFVIAVVFRANDNDTNTSGMQGDYMLLYDTDNTRYFRVYPSGNEYGLYLGGGGSGANGGTPDTNIHLAMIYGPNFNSASTDIVEIDDVNEISVDAGSSGFGGGLVVGGKNLGSEFNGDVLEIVPYDNPTKTEINNEKTRLKNKYAGISF